MNPGANGTGIHDLDCIDGHCAVANACVLRHGAAAQAYNVANDPDEKVNLLTASAAKRLGADPMGACYDAGPGTPGRALHEKLSCELVRWCLEGCQVGASATLDCGACKTALCDDCGPAPCAQCLDDKTCYKVAENTCVDCRRTCANGDHCADLGVACVDGKCEACQVRIVGSTSTTTTVSPTTTTTTLSCSESMLTSLCSGPCDVSCGVCSLDWAHSQCVCVDGPVGCNFALAQAGGGCGTGTCPDGLTCQVIWFTCGCDVP
jgi:hypothetical protein